MKKIFILFSFALFTSFIFAQQINRGPYMQMPTESSIIFRWRTNAATSSKVWWGNSPTNLTQFLENNNTTQEHTMQITGLSPYTKYYYAVGNTASVLAGADSSHYFMTTPISGTEQPIRMWVTGDFGKGNQGQIETKTSYEQFTKSEHRDTDIWLWLGDNAYQDGKDSEYQSKVFNLAGYSDIFSWLPFWPTPGNHDYNTIWQDNGILSIPYTLSSISDHQGPYFDIVDVPKYAEQGGYQSTHEVFYSYDYGNVHLLSLNSEVYHISNNNVLNLMKNWIHQDLQQNTKEWVIAYWHQPPYSKGSHDSDQFFERVMKTMREDIIPILESYDIDLIVCGHSHVYERSFLIKDHFDESNTFNPATMLVDGGNGNRAQGTPYIKPPTSTNGGSNGTVYTVVGNSGSSNSSGSLNHPVMTTSLGGGTFGSLVIDVYKNELRGRYLQSDGQFLDDYSIVKQNMSLGVLQDAFICEHDSVSLSVNTTKGSDEKHYLWQPGNYTSQSITVSPSTTTTYVVRVTDSVSLQVLFDTVTVTVDNIPFNPVITENAGILSCPAGYNQYKWYRDGVLVSATGNTFNTQSIQGTYTVEIAGNTQTCLKTTPPFYFYDIDLQANANKNEVCAGDSVIIYITTSGGSDSTSIYWENPNSTQLNIYYTPLNSGYIIAKAEDYISGEIEADSLEITVHPLPNVLLSQSGNMLSTLFNSNYTYKWYLNNQVIANTSNELSATENGTYYVEVIDENNCKNTSNSIQVNLNAITDNINKKDYFIVYPNPNEGVFSIRSKSKIQSLSIYDETGKQIKVEGKTNKTISLKNISKGKYFIKIKTAEGTYIRTFIIE